MAMGPLGYHPSGAVGKLLRRRSVGVGEQLCVQTPSWASSTPEAGPGDGAGYALFSQALTSWHPLAVGMSHTLSPHGTSEPDLRVGIST